MHNTSTPTTLRPRSSVIAVAACQFLVSLSLLALTGVVIYREIFPAPAPPYDLHDLPQPPLYFNFLFPGILFCVFLSVIIAAIGLLRLKAWAKWMTLSFATLPVSFCIAVLIFNHYYPVALDPLSDSDPFAAAVLRSLVILIPVSVWWWFVFTRGSVRAQFRR
jgi:hypothetical protein